MSETLTEWLLSEATLITSTGELVEAFCEAALRRKIPIDRVFLGTIVPHPQAAGVAVIYDRATEELKELEIDPLRFEELHRDHRSPIRFVLQRGSELRAPLSKGVDLGMSDLRELREQGHTDYIGLPLSFMGRTAGAFGLSTRHPDGFSDEQLRRLRAAMPALSAVAYLVIQRLVQRTLLQAYLGQDAGSRVHRGQVRRGQGATLRAAILFADMRGFTKLSTSQPRDVVLECINAVFEVVVEAVQAQGGQVLKFMGDGLLATFGNPSDHLACIAAERAALQAQTVLDELATKRLTEDRYTPGLGLGLHLGEVMYGNIGAPGRLDFTVIGEAVNLAARIEAVCSKVDEKILMSADFVGALNQERRRCGEFELKGVPHPVAVFAPNG